MLPPLRPRQTKVYPYSSRLNRMEQYCNTYNWSQIHSYCKKHPKPPSSLLLVVTISAGGRRAPNNTDALWESTTHSLTAVRSTPVRCHRVRNKTGTRLHCGLQSARGRIGVGVVPTNASYPRHAEACKRRPRIDFEGVKPVLTDSEWGWIRTFENTLGQKLTDHQILKIVGDLRALEAPKG